MSLDPRKHDKVVESWSSRAYVKGFLISLALTLTAWFLVNRHVETHHTFLSDNLLIGIILPLALAQLIAQLFFFLHLGQESKPRWNLTLLAFAAITVVILVLGSLWIMYNLDYHHARNEVSPEELNRTIIEEEGIHR